MSKTIKMSVSPYRLKTNVFAGVMQEVYNLCPRLTADESGYFVNQFTNSYSEFNSARKLDASSQYTPAIRMYVKNADSAWLLLTDIANVIVRVADSDFKSSAASLKTITDRYGRIDTFAYKAKFHALELALSDLDRLGTEVLTLMNIGVYVSTLHEALANYLSLVQLRNHEREVNAYRKTKTRAELNKAFTKLVKFVESMADEGEDECYADFIDGVNEIDFSGYIPGTDSVSEASGVDTSEASSGSGAGDAESPVETSAADGVTKC